MVKFITQALVVAVAAASLAANAAETNAPFARGALTQAQLDAWSNYLVEESNLFGCTYGDDPRLQEDPEGTIQALYNKEEMEPIQVTYRTLLNMGPSTREIVSNNISIASMECNTVYYDGKALTGTPVIPFEEAMTILHDDYAMYQSEERILALRDTFLVAGMDPRWFWSYFIADRAHMDLIGLDFDTLVTVDKIVNKRDNEASYKDDSYHLPYQIHKGLHHRPIAYYSASGECESSNAEPSKDLIVWPEITDDIVSNYYWLNEVRFYGDWELKATKTEGGFTLYEESPADDENFPAFSVTRGMGIYSNACKSDKDQPVLVTEPLNNEARTL